MSSLGSFLKQARVQKRITQEELAFNAKLARSYISRLEDDKIKSPSAIVLIRLSNALGVSHQALFHAAGYGASLKEDRLPSMGVYLRSKYPKLSEEAIKQLESFKLYLEKTYKKSDE